METEVVHRIPLSDNLVGVQSADLGILVVVIRVVRPHFNRFVYHPAKLGMHGILVFQVGFQSGPGEPGKITDPFSLLQRIARGPGGQKHIAGSFQVITEFGPGLATDHPLVVNILRGLPP